MLKSDILELIKIAIPSAAVIISIVALIKSQRNIQKQIRVNKLEEILEILSRMESYYMPMYILLSDLIRIKLSQDKEKTNLQQKELNDKIERFFSSVDKDKLQNYFARLHVLANAYLPNNKVRLKILTLSHMYDVIILSLIHKEIHALTVGFKEGIPKPKNLTLYIDTIQKQMIKEMQLGYDSISMEKLLEYFNKEFKKDCGIV